MPLPTSPTWNIADFSGPSLAGLLSLGPGDLTITPSTSPYFFYNDDLTVLSARSADGALAQLDFNVGVPSLFTIEMTVRFPAMPHNLGDLERRRAGITLADDASRGVSIYFASTGVAVSRVDHFGSVSALEDTADTTREIGSAFRTIRVAVNGGLGRAYVFIGNSEGVTPEVRFVLPVEETPTSVTDLFRLFVKGTPSEPSHVEIVALRVAGSLVIPNFPPTADAGPDRVAPVGQAVRFDGRQSFDVEGAPITYDWRVVDVPYGSAFAADVSSGSSTDDGDADGFTNTLSFAAGTLPSWVAPNDTLKINNTLHVIDTVDNPGGTLTVVSDTVPDALSAQPFRIFRQSLLVGDDTEAPYALPDIQGVYRFRLIVNDGESDSEASEVLANIVGARAPFGIEPDLSVLWKGLGDDWNYIQYREVFEEAWKGITQILAGKLLEVWQHHYNYSIRDAQRVFQRKWLPYRPLVSETSPSTAIISPRYGILRAAHPFEGGTPVVAGLSLSVEIYTGTTPTDTDVVEVMFSANDLATIVSELNAALVGTGISAYSYAVRQDVTTYRHNGTSGSTPGAVPTSTFNFPALSLQSWVAPGDTLIVGGERYTIATVNNAGGVLTITSPELEGGLGSVNFIIYRHCRLGLKGSRAFRVVSSSAAAPLGFEIGVFNYLRGDDGAIVTDRTYYAGDGVELSESNVNNGDLLVLNRGQSFRIDRVLTGSDDPQSGQRLLLSDELPFDASEEWEIPSVVRSTEVDYEFQATYPGDLVKIEVYDLTAGTTTDALGYVVAQKERQVAVNLDGLFGALQGGDQYELRLIGVKRRKAIPIHDDTVSIPQLQDLIPQSASPTLWKEHVHYILEPFYRDIDGAPIPMLQFRDAVFIEPDLEPPDILWAELTLFSNDQNVEDLFGRLAGFYRDDAASFGPDFNYVAGVAGLLYAHQRGPSVHAVRVGAQILLGQPFAEAGGTIEEIRPDFSPLKGRVLIRDGSDNDITSETVRSYLYRKDPLDTSATSGLALNQETGQSWAEGDAIPQFAPIGAGVELVDMQNDPSWYIPYVRSGNMTEIEKFHTFLVRFNLDLVSLANLALLFQFVAKVKPKYTYPLLVGLRVHEDDIDVIDEISAVVTAHLFDSVCGSGRAYMYDDYRGDGTIWSTFDDGLTHYDSIVDCPLDIIEFELTISWGGGVITYDSAFFLDTMVVDVSGVHTGTPGSSFSPTYDMTLPAGDYIVTVTIKGGGVILP